MKHGMHHATRVAEQHEGSKGDSKPAKGDMAAVKRASGGSVDAKGSYKK